MQDTKRKFHKENGVQAHHYIQSFKPHEITAKEAHIIGKKFAEEAFKGHQVIYATHVDKEHIHNHFIVNSVGLDGKKFDSRTRTLYTARDISNSICLEHNKHIIEPTQNRTFSKPIYSYHQDKNKPTYDNTKKYNVIRNDIDKTISESKTYQEFKSKLMAQGYQVNEHKYLSLKPPHYRKSVRTKSLGEMYTKENLIDRIEQKEKYQVGNTSIFELRKETRAEKRAYIDTVNEKFKMVSRYHLNDRRLTDVLQEVNHGIVQLEQNQSIVVQNNKQLSRLLDELTYVETHPQSDPQMVELTQKFEKSGVTKDKYSAVRKALETNIVENNIKFEEYGSTIQNLKEDYKTLKSMEKYIDHEPEQYHEERQPERSERSREEREEDMER